MKIHDRIIGPGRPCYIVAELSANHGGDFELAVRTIRAMKEAGADAVKVQTYTADTLTIRCDKPPFRISGGTLWDGRTLHELYEEACMPWDWQPRLRDAAADLGMDFFSTPFDASAVDFLERLGVPVHKVASFELVDLPLLRRIAGTGKPVIMSTGMATREEIEESLNTLRAAGSGPVALLKCTSAYPAAPDEMNLRTLPDMGRRYGVPVGLSDHTMGHAVPVAAVALGACIVEKHFILSRSQPGPDSSFSMEPQEFRAMVEAIRATETALGRVNYRASEKEAKSRVFRRSLFVVEDMAAGERFTEKNLRCIRPGHGLHPRHLEAVMGRAATGSIERGTPLRRDLVTGDIGPGPPKVVAIIQARLKSTRLPAKVLLQLGGRTVLEHVAHRVGSARHIHDVWIATTISPADDAIAAEALRLGLPCFRGSEEDVLDRYRETAAASGADVIVRVTSDCPLIDSTVLDRMLESFAASPCDYLSNVLERTFPRGLDAEIFTRNALEENHRDARLPQQREHVTPFIYQHPDRFRLRGFARQGNIAHHRWTLDTPEDLEVLQGIFSALGDDASTDDVVAFLDAHPEVARLNSHIEPATRLTN